jgi:hypothetical protein
MGGALVHRPPLAGYRLLDAMMWLVPPAERETPEKAEV